VRRSLVGRYGSVLIYLDWIHVADRRSEGADVAQYPDNLSRRPTYGKNLPQHCGPIDTRSERDRGIGTRSHRPRRPPPDAANPFAASPL
jgi:hypothetical protein